jgi:cation:H+ antiporter
MTVAVTSLLFFLLGCVLLVYGAELLVRGASWIATTIGISPLVIGLTVVAYGTSAPELAVSLESSFNGQPDLAVGNIVGSNIANVLLILGLSAVVSPLIVSKQLIRLEVPLMVAISIAMFFMGIDGAIDRSEGLLLFFSGVIYTIFVLWQSRRDEAAKQGAMLEQNSDGENQLDLRAVRPRPRLVLVLVNLFWLLIGLGMLVLGSRSLIHGAVAIARLVGVSELIIGLTIVAVGTSLPELATSVIASMRGEKDIAVGNVIGSNIFNILVVLGLSSIITPGGVAVSLPAMRFDIPVMIAVAIACLPIFFTDYVVTRREGWLFLAYYATYTAYLLFHATHHDSLGVLSAMMIAFVVAFTVVAIGRLLRRALSAKPHS